MLILKGNPGFEEKKVTHVLAKKFVPQQKANIHDKDQDSLNMGSLTQAIQRLSNKVIDLKKSYGETSCNKKSPSLHTSAINLGEATRNYCQAHKANHSKKNYP